MLRNHHLIPELIAVMNKQAWVGYAVLVVLCSICGVVRSVCPREENVCSALCCASVRKVDLHLLMQMEFSFDSSCPVLFGSSHPMLAFLLPICQNAMVTFTVVLNF